mgnify:FL=1
MFQENLIGFLTLFCNMIKVESLKKSFEGKAIFENISFVLNRGEKIGVVGKNGCGKSTLFKIIIGEVEPDSGRVIIENERIGYLPQSIEIDFKKDIKNFFSERLKVEDWQIKKSLGKLGLYNLDLGRKIQTFSGGEITRIMLAKILIEKPTILLLDEPTNHLDIEGILYIQKFLTQFNGGVLLISHDRWILDKVPKKIIDFQITEKGRVTKIYPGNFSAYKEIREREIEKQKYLYKLQQKKIKNLKKDIKEKKEQAKKMDRNMLAELREKGIPLGSSGTKLARRAKAEEKQIQKLLESERKIEKPQEEKKLKIFLNTSLKLGQRVFKIENISFSFNKKIIFNSVNLEMYGNDRMALLGPNGSGKTTFLKLLLGELKPQKGKIILNPSIEIGYLPQEIIFENYQKRVIEEFQKDLEISETEGRKILSKFLFSNEEQFKKLKDLSLGERKRLYLAKIFASGSNFLLLDEPTNHLDIDSVEALEKAFIDFKGGIFVISHDRYFLKNIGIGKFYFLKEGKLKEIFSIDDIEKL